MAYFYLVRSFGAVPIIHDNTDELNSGNYNSKFKVEAADVYELSLIHISLQVAPGVYNDTILAGLDYFMNELRERDMTAVLYLHNSWEWSGGYSVYLQWSGHGDAVVPVSYTHLDVYKRQLLPVPGRQTRCRVPRMFRGRYRNRLRVY